MNSNIKIAKKILADTEKKINSWNERSQFKLKGVGNLSMSDIETIQLYATTMIQSSGQDFNGLMSPRGSIKQIFDNYGIV